MAVGLITRKSARRPGFCEMTQGSALQVLSLLCLQSTNWETSSWQWVIDGQDSGERLRNQIYNLGKNDLFFIAYGKYSHQPL